LEDPHSSEVVPHGELAGGGVAAGKLSAAGSSWIQGFGFGQRLYPTKVVGRRFQW
jgi:hypothetical protein